MIMFSNVDEAIEAGVTKFLVLLFIKGINNLGMFFNTVVA